MSAFACTRLDHGYAPFPPAGQRLVAKSPQAGGGEGDYNSEGVMATADDFGNVNLFRLHTPY